ncbi:putative hydrolase [Escherichia coli]|nr:putative hydrolase [Escherichia coli]
MQLRITSRKKLTALLCALGLISIVAIYPRQTVNFFYSTAVQITDYIHFYGYRPVKSFAIRIPASYTIHGIDVSRWQERIDWQRVAKMRDNGIRLQFAFIKATEGEKLVDPYFSRNWQLSRENGLLRGAYHYFSPSVAAPVQARLFLQTVDFSQGDFPAVLDVEERGKLSAKELRKRVSQWLKMVEKSTGKKPIIYSGAVFITPIWRAISMNIRGGWLTTINVVRTMTAWPGASGSIPTVDR